MMNRWISAGVWVLAGSLLGGGQVQAAQGHSFEVGTEVFGYEYKEAGIMENDGVLYGVAGAYTYRGPLFAGRLPKAMLGAEIRIAAGQVDYTSTNTGSMDNINDLLFETRGLAGYDFQLSQSTALTPFAGLGYRYLNDDAAGMVTTTGHFGYERRSYYLYAPIGLRTRTVFNRNWSLGFNAEYDIFLWGKQQSLLSEVSSIYPDIEVDQESGYGFRASISLTRTAPGLSFSIEPFINYWDIDESERAVFPVGSFIVTAWEPKNESTEIGIKLAVEF